MATDQRCHPLIYHPTHAKPTSSENDISIDTALKGCVVDWLKVNRERVVADDSLLKHGSYKRRNNGIVRVVKAAQWIRAYMIGHVNA